MNLRMIVNSEGARLRPNNTLERTVKYRGRIVLAMDCVLADAQWRWWPAEPPDLEPRASDLHFTWRTVGVAAIVVVYLGYLALDADLGYKVAMTGAAVIAMVLVAPKLFGESRPFIKPDTDLRSRAKDRDAS